MQHRTREGPMKARDGWVLLQSPLKAPAKRDLEPHFEPELRTSVGFKGHSLTSLLAAEMR